MTHTYYFNKYPNLVRSHYQDNCILKCAYVFKLLCKEVPDYGLREPKHVAVCDVTLKWCVGRHTFVCL
jgi:hypothetical protein